MHTILIVDDEKDYRDILSAKLKASGFSVHEAENGLKGIEAAKKIRPDLVLMDVQMPVLGGVQALTQLKADPDTANIKVLFLTNYGEEDVANAWIDNKFAMEMGAVGHMRKSDDLDSLVQHIRSILA